MRPVRWRTRWRFWLLTGIKLGKLAKQPGVVVTEDSRGCVTITEMGFAAPPAGPTDYLDHLEQQNGLRQVLEDWPQSFQASTYFNVYDQEAPPD